MKFWPSIEQEVSIESFLRTACHQTGAELERQGQGLSHERSPIAAHSTPSELNVAASAQLGGFYLWLVFHGKVYGICDEALRMSLRV